MPEQKIITQNLINLVKHSGYTQREFGDIYGVSEKSISHWINGRYDPSGEFAAKIARSYGITHDELFNLKLKFDSSGMITNIPKRQKQVNELHKKLKEVQDGLAEEQKRHKKYMDNYVMEVRRITGQIVELSRLNE